MYLRFNFRAGNEKNSHVGEVAGCKMSGAQTVNFFME